jgi:D-alanyl-D-alanine carboxypeptidase
MKKRGIGLFLLATGLALMGNARTAEQLLPQTPSGRRVEAYLKAFNSGESAMREFMAGQTAKESLQKVPVEVRLNRYRQMHDRLGALDLRRVIESRDDFVSVIVHGSKGPLVNLEFQFEPAEPFGLIGIRITDVGEEDIPANPKKDRAEFAAAVRDYAKKLSGADEFSGVILVAQNSTPFLEEAYGLADREKKIPNRVDTKFNIGSINKSFTGLAVQQLISQKKISPDDPIKKFLPDYPNPDAAEKVTVRHLLDMSSGIGDFFGEKYQATPKEKIRSLPDYLPLFADQPLEFEPGTKNRYSNGGYIVLGLIIEKASGMDYYTYIRNHLYKPAGMGDTDSFDRSTAIPNRAVGYTRDGSSRKPNDDTLPWKGSSAGGGYSTARDLLKYILAWKDGKLGAAEEKTRSELMIAGGAPGLNAALYWDPKSTTTIVVLANYDPPAAEQVVRQIRSWLPR